MMPYFNVKYHFSAKSNTQAFKQANGKTVIFQLMNQKCLSQRFTIALIVCKLSNFSQIPRDRPLTNQR